MRVKSFLYILIIPLIFVGCSPKYEKYTESKITLGTVVRADVCFDVEQKDKVIPAVKKAFDKIAEINRRMSVFDKESDIFRLNNAPQKILTVHLDTYEILNSCRDYSKITEGAFDITVGSVEKFWKHHEDINKFPSRAEIESAIDAVGMENISYMTDRKISLRNKKTRLDLGGIAKGYAVDQAVKILKEEGFVNFLIDAGGDIFASGFNCKDLPWKIGIRDPRNKSKFLDIILARDIAVTTSGNYEQFYEIEGERWSHIINPITGYPQKDVISATVIARTVKEADALSTALCVLGGKRGTQIVESVGLGRVAAIAFERSEKNKLRIYKTSNYDEFR